MSATEFKDQGNKHLKAEEFDEAIECYTKAIQLNPEEHTFYSNRSAAYLSKGDAQTALYDAIKCCDVKSDWAKGHARKGAALHALKQYAEAKDAYEDGLKISPNDPGCLSGVKEVQKILSAPPGGGMGGGMGGLFNQQMLSKLATHPKFGPKLADPAFKMKLQMMQTNPQMMMQDPEMMEVLTAIIGLSGDGSEDSPAPTPPPKPAAKEEPKKSSVPDYSSMTEEEKAEAQKRQKSIEAKDKGNAFYKEKKFDEALSAYNEGIDIDSSNVMIRNNKAAVYIEMGETDKAIEICKEAIEYAKENSIRLSYEEKAKIYQRIAAAHLKAENHDEAIQAWKTAQMEHFDKNIDRKMKNMELEMKKKAIADYIDPEKGLEAKERGNTAFRDGDFGKAISEYEEAIKRDPKSAAYRNNLAATLVKVGDVLGAKNQVEKALEIDDKYVKAWAKKGDVEFLMKEYHKAMDSYKAGLAIEADNAACKQGLQKVTMKIHSASSEDQAERQAHAMADPEIQQILQDPAVRQTLSDLQENPAYGQQAMTDPTIRAKIEKLIAAGVLQVK